MAFLGPLCHMDVHMHHRFCSQLLMAWCTYPRVAEIQNKSLWIKILANTIVGWNLTLYLFWSTSINLWANFWIYILHFHHTMVRTVLLFSFMCYCVHYLVFNISLCYFFSAYLWYHLSRAPYHICFNDNVFSSGTRCLWDHKRSFQ